MKGTDRAALAPAALRGWFEEKTESIRSARRDLHRIPELGFSETETSAYIAKALDSLGIAYESGVGKTGLVGRLGQGGPGRPRIAIRADMDALPIREAPGKPYASTHDGLMHACGHDAHCAMLLGAAEFLKLNEASLPGEILLVFQPAEERSDGSGRTGARHVLGSGLLEGAKAVLGAHVTPDLPAGSFGILSGPVTASGDMFEALIRGKGGHDAFVHRTVDPIFLATQALNAVYAIRSRKLAPDEAGTLSVGTFEAGTTANVIPDRARLTGTIRTFSPRTRDTFLAELRRALGVVDALGGSFELAVPVSVPLTMNDPFLAGMAREACAELFGEGAVQPLEPVMGVEDFSWYSASFPSLFLFLGAKLEDGLERPLHSSSFDIDDGALHRGSALLALTALETLDVAARGQMGGRDGRR